MNVLLTGGAGYIGSHTAVVLSQLGHQVILYDNLSNSSCIVLEKLAQIAGRKIPFVKGDVRDTGLLSNVLASYEINAVVHFAGLKAVGESAQKPIDYYTNNVQGTISLLQAMQLRGIKTIVFSSSATVYGEPRYLPLDENHPTNATNPYGRTKLHVEEMLRDVVTSDSQWRIACLRYFNPVGAHESGLIGESPCGAPNNLMPYIVQVAAGQRAKLEVFGGDYPTPDGTGVRDYIHVMDLAEGHAATLNLLSQTTGWHAINLGTGKGYSVLDMIQAFEKASGRQVPYEVVARRAGDVAECFAYPNKARELLNMTARRTLNEMCASAWRFQQSIQFE
ncbi:UDP-glucose 4-epimerase GalE [uncultured Propionivibrio sp.]|uniref:UDP-glucose 4-epimerase GalE n=1 Tax=uncultured Propionivibrio sp. TaxID=426737 RepID=UPI0029C051BA|nr:UDP-glucose 4-epimerase GalE [uncultured Propionivibrio sp.]